tara:strand:- start:159 stop:491 length:333 start_codon:yes stop_codon:yes gene_type:complete
MKITIGKKKIDKLAEFIRKNNLDHWFMAKDDGAYIGASTGPERVIYYFAGCNPDKDEYAWETARDKFGGDDFGEHFAVEDVLTAADNEKTHSITVTVGREAIDISVSTYT